MRLIADGPGVRAFCEGLAGERFVTVDTEFMRDRTFYPKLCLVQVAGSSAAAAIDPLAPGVDLGPLLDLMRDPGVLKVFHAARQDIEIFHRLMGGEVPRPLHDTQVAAMVCGYGDEASYETLVTKVAKGRLDKSSRFTDWSKRPLSEAQLRYALSDVTFLRTIHERLEARIEAAGRAAWVADELEGLADPRQFEAAPEEAWRRIKLRTRDPRFLAIVQRLAAWRDRTARERDLPRARVLRDDLLLEVAASRPASLEALKGLDRVNLDRRGAEQVAALVREALELPAEALPPLPAEAETPRGLGPLVELLRVLLKIRSEEAEVAQRLLASAAELEAIALDDAAPVPALAGWRREMFGADALALKRGEIGLTAHAGRPAVVRLGPAAADAAPPPAP